MKKALSLLLAVVMILSVLTVSAGAETFTDSAAIAYPEAVEVMTAIDIVDGYADGTFNPTGMLTRGAAAKIICNMILGPTVAGALPADTAPFPDVPADHVFAGYIAYCQSKGIINGYADGTFKPAGSLTGNAFLKMLLGALGYDAIREGYVGENWTVSVAKQALRLGLDDGLAEDFNGTKALNRQEAMLYAFNTLTSTMVEYDSPTDIVIGNAVVSSESNAKVVKHTSGYDYRGGSEGANGTMQFCEQYFSKLTATATRDAMGRPATKWVNDRTEIGEFVDAGNMVISVQGVLNKQKLRDYIGQDLSDKLVAGDPSAVLTVYVDGAVVNGPGVKPINTTFVTSNLLERSSSMTISTRWITRSSKTDIFVDNDAASGKTEVTICIEGPHLYQAVGSFNPVNETLNIMRVSANEPAPCDLPNIIELSQEDFNISGYQDGDYVLVTYSHLEDEVQTIAKARTVSGAMTGFLLNTSLELDGTTYYYNGHERVGTTTANGNYHATESTLQIWQNAFVNGNNVTAVLDSRGYVMWIDSLDNDGTSAKYVYVDTFAKTGLLGNQGALVGYLTDGTYVEAPVSKIVGQDGGTYEKASYVDQYITEDTDDDGIADSSYPNDAYDMCPTGRWYRYSTSGDNYSLRYISPSAASGYTVETKSIPRLTTGSILLESKISFCPSFPAYKANDATVFLLLDPDEELTVYEGIRSIPQLKASRNVTANSVKMSMILDGSFAKYVFLDYSATGNRLTETTTTKYDSNYVMILQNQSSWRYINDEEQYVEVSALVDGTQKTIRVLREAGKETSELTTGVLYKNVVVNEDGYYVRGTEVGAQDNELAAKNSSLPVSGDDDVLILGSETLILTPETAVNLVVYKEAGSHLGNKGAQFELHTGLSAKALARQINRSPRYTYNYFAVLNDDFSAVPTTLYIFLMDDVIDAANNSEFIQSTTGEMFITADLDDTNIKAKDQLLAEGTSAYCARVTLNTDAFNPNDGTVPFGGGKQIAASGQWSYDLKITRNGDGTVIVDSQGLAPTKMLSTSAMSLYGSLLDDSFRGTGKDFTVEITMHITGSEDIYMKHSGFQILQAE